MQIQVSVAALSLALAAFTTEASVPVTIYNQCSENVDLYDNSAVETIAPGGTTSRKLAEGFSGMFRNGVSSQATLAEFAVTGGFLWYDISIIPTGSVGPGYCSSLEECKAVTGGTGYNTPMQIAPSGCTTVTCLQDGCADAYQYPRMTPKPTPSYSAPYRGSYDATSYRGPTQPPTQPPTEAPTQTPTEAPTPTPTETPTETPTSTPEVAYTSSNSTSDDEEQEAATVTPSKVTKTGTTTTATTVSAPSTSTSSKSNNDNTETVNTQASSDNNTGAGTYVATGLGGCAVIAAVAVVAVARKKKKELDATEGKEYNQEELMTPVTQINVL
ncbi:Thaumatin [Phytophthora cactorum]|nr:Thaumatin [Phytophthora cactorum]